MDNKGTHKNLRITFLNIKPHDCTGLPQASANTKTGLKQTEVLPSLEVVAECHSGGHITAIVGGYTCGTWRLALATLP